MKSVAIARFWHLFRALPGNIQHLAVKNYKLWRLDPQHRSLHFRRLQGSSDRFTIRVGDRHRALGRLTDDTMVWVWNGTHAEYDRLVNANSRS